ncbi:MAG TPA: hypothetical protein VNZ44_02585 [Pyrinomonadaceae bacterium]|nr:hypothetical protein [Pyrinomonadaceae bacterium]
MKALYLATALAFLILFDARDAHAQTRQPELKMTAEVVGRRYCAGGSLNILQLTVRLRYRNEGGRKLILYRGKNFFYQTKIRGAGAGGRPYEVVVTNSRYNDAEAEDVNTRRPSGAFVTLPPGGALEDGVVIGVGVTRAGSERPPNTIAPGEHTLQIVASSWYESRKLAEELRGRWQGSGLLWIDPVATEPLKFDAGTDAPAAACR